MSSRGELMNSTAGKPTTPKMRDDLQNQSSHPLNKRCKNLVGIYRQVRNEPVDLPTRVHHDVRDRGRETRPAALVPRNPVVQRARTYQKRWRKTNSNADGKHVRLPQKPYTLRTGEMDKDEVPNEEGRADPAENGTAGGKPRHEVSPRKSNQ